MSSVVKIWDEQQGFNSLLRNQPKNEVEIAEFLRDMSINMMSELDELLRTTTWKKHRRLPAKFVNHDHRLEEVVDLFKIWLTIAQGLGYTPDQIDDMFWKKSMVCRQRHSEEWVKDSQCPSVVVDIDNVLCDYIVGFCDWIANRAPLTAPYAAEVKRNRSWIHKAAQFGLTETEWQGFKHEFRSRGYKRYLPLMPGAAAFLHRIRQAGYNIILLTSRPIDRFPNLYGDTLAWLTDNQLPFDFVWWSPQKGELLIERGQLKHVAFVVDDDTNYIDQFIRAGLVSWHYQPYDNAFMPREWEENPAVKKLLRIAKSLDAITIPVLPNDDEVKGYGHGVRRPRSSTPREPQR